MAQGSGSLHEDPDVLGPEVIDQHRAIVSIMEELEAADWYNQRVAAGTDPELRDILAHNRDEEKEHAAMTLEWLRRRDKKLDEHLAAKEAEAIKVREAHAVRVDALVKEFDASAQAMVGIVSTAAAKLQSAATSMSATAKETSRQSTAVAAASEQASTNVETVASATEQLSASVREVGLQVAESAKIATKAVEEAQLRGNAGSVFIGRTGRVRRLDAQAR